MTEGYRPGDGEGGQRPSGRGAVTERLAGQGRGGATEVDLTDEAARGDTGDDTVASPAARPGGEGDRESAGTFEPAAPAAPTADPPAEAARQGASIFDLDQRAKQEDLDRTGYEPAVSGADPAGPRGQTTVTEPGEARTEPAAEPAPAAAGPGPLLGSLDPAGVRARVLDIQAGFVDEPRQAVEEAGRLVDDLLRQVSEALQAQRGQLAGADADSSTEDLRLTLRAYRRFVDRLLGLAS